MRESPAPRSPEQLTNDPPGTFVGRRSELRSLAALGPVGARPDPGWSVLCHGRYPF